MARSFRKGGRKGRKFKPRKRFRECQFCKDKKEPDYKDASRLSQFLLETGKITSRKVNSCCAKHQRKLSTAVKRARFLALLPFVQKP